MKLFCSFTVPNKMVMLGTSLLLILASCGPSGSTSQPRITDPTPNPLSLSAAVGESAVGNVSFTNAGNSVLSFTVTGDADWLNVSPTSGSLTPNSSQTLTLSASCGDAEDTYAGTVTIRSNDPDPDRETRQVAVNLTCDSEVPIISNPTPNPLELAALVGRTATGQVTFQNSGGVPLDFSVTTDQDWLSASPASGSVAAGDYQALAVSATCSDAPGNVSGYLIITATQASTPSKQVAVNLGCSASGPIITAPLPNPLTLSALSGEAATGEISFQNAGDAALMFTVSTSQTWLSVTPTSGSVAPDGTQELTITAICPGDAGDYSGTATISSNDPDSSRSSRDIAVALTCAPPPPPFVCQDSSGNLTCTVEEAGITVLVPWQGREVVVRSLPLSNPSQSLVAASSGFELIRLLFNFEVVDESTSEPITTFDPPIQVTAAYTADDFSNATPTLEQGELGLAAWDESGSQWTLLGHGVYSQGFWVADPAQASGFELKGQPRFKMTGSTNTGTATASVSEATSSFLLAWAKLPWDPEHILVPFDGECEQIEDEELTCTSTAAGVTVSLPDQNSDIRVKMLALPMNKPATLTPTMIEDEEVAPIRLLMNLVVVDADYPTTVLDEFSPAMSFDIIYTAQDRSLAAEASGKLRLAYWHEEIEEIVVLGQGNTDNCQDSPGCSWGEAVAADALVFVENETATGGNAFGTFSKWGDRMLMTGQ
jgi:hypothetical protein